MFENCRCRGAHNILCCYFIAPKKHSATTVSYIPCFQCLCMGLLMGNNGTPCGTITKTTIYLSCRRNINTIHVFSYVFGYTSKYIVFFQPPISGHGHFMETVLSEEIQKPCLPVGALCGRLRVERRLRLCRLERCRYVTLMLHLVLRSLSIKDYLGRIAHFIISVLAKLVS